ncbi:MAG: pitrilysin family protein [Aestuariivita sp.]|nr:pitrilysin family protein [Aestuariivita sp.]
MSISLDTLPNGVRIVTEHMPGLKSAAVGIWVSAGGRHERQEQNGVAHFLEHMAFKGTSRRSALQIAEEIEDVGGYINAYTSREVTAYFARVLENDVALALDVIVDILLNPLFQPNEIETERGVILQEIGQTRDTPDDVIFEWLQERSYLDQSMGRSILGSSGRVQQFSRTDLLNFVKEHYGPERLILSATGAVNHSEIMALADEHLGKLSPRDVCQVEPASFTNGEVRVEKNLEQTHFALAFESPGYRDDKIFEAQVYAIALGGGMSSRLFQEIRERRGLCYTIYAQIGAYSDTGTMTIYAGTSEESISELSTVTIDEIKRIADTVDEQEILRARAQMKAGLLMGLESPSSRAERLARLVQIWGRVPSLDETIEKIDAVTIAKIREFAEFMATQTPMTLALYGPIANAPTYDALQQRRVT